MTPARKHHTLTQPSPNPHPTLTQPSPNPQTTLTQPSNNPHTTLVGWNLEVWFQMARAPGNSHFSRNAAGVPEPTRAEDPQAAFLRAEGG